MRKTLFVLIILVTFLISCGPEVNYYGSLTVNNSPTGYSFIVLIYPSNVLPTTYAEYNSMTTGAIAAGTGASPVKLSWSGGTKSGNYLVTITSGSIKKMVIGNFNNKGEATVNWSTMPNVPSYGN